MRLSVGRPLMLQLARATPKEQRRILSTMTQTAAYRSGGWELGVLRGSNVMIDGEQVIGAKAAPIVEPAGGVQVDAEARTAIGAILAALRQHGLIAT